MNRASLSNGYFIGPVTPNDKPAYMEHLNDRRIYECTMGIPFPYTEADADWWTEQRILKSTAKETLFAIRNAQGCLVGSVDAGSKSIPGIDLVTEIGYWLAVPHWGKGVMTEAVGWICGYAFGELRYKRLTAHVFSFNRRSARVLEKNGFRLEGTLKGHDQKDGVSIDASLYVLDADVRVTKACGGSSPVSGR